MKQVKTIVTLILVILVLASMYSFMRDEKIKMAEDALKEMYTIDDLEELIEYEERLMSLSPEAWVEEVSNPDVKFFDNMTKRGSERILQNRVLYIFKSAAIAKNFEMKVTKIVITEDFYREAKESDLHEFTRQGYDYKVTLEITYLDDGAKEIFEEKGKIAFSLIEDEWLIDIIKPIGYKDVFVYPFIQ